MSVTVLPVRATATVRRLDESMITPLFTSPAGSESGSFLAVTPFAQRADHHPIHIAGQARRDEHLVSAHFHSFAAKLAITGGRGDNDEGLRRRLLGRGQQIAKTAVVETLFAKNNRDIIPGQSVLGFFYRGKTFGGEAEPGEKATKSSTVGGFGRSNHYGIVGHVSPIGPSQSGIAGTT